MRVNNVKHCHNCGAPVTSEICPYCNAATGLDTRFADMEYEVIDCREANMNFWNVIFPMIFAFSFGSVGLFIPFVLMIDDAEVLPIVLFLGMFGLIGLVAFIIGITPVIRHLMIKYRGRDIEATVYGYMDDNILLNGAPAQIVKLLVNTDEGPKFILYQLGDTKQPFKINSKINLQVYKDMFYMPKKKKYYFN
ncbi:MAG: zinc ribbon domain-containing protein [Bacilli bacterium]|nr:zinc ribbon domain-containing protein [Bacilli bacterium]